MDSSKSLSERSCSWGREPHDAPWFTPGAADVLARAVYALLHSRASPPNPELLRPAQARRDPLPLRRPRRDSLPLGAAGRGRRLHVRATFAPPVTRSSSSCANVSTSISAAPVPAVSRASLEG